MNAVLYESMTYDRQFLPLVFSIRDVPISYHPMLFNQATLQCSNRF
jgi:hypothetical protein